MPDLFVSPENNQQDVSTEEPQASAAAIPSAPIQATPSLHPVGMFETYCENPGNVTFGTQEPEEKILLFLRRDFITNVPWITTSLILIIAPMTFIILANLTNIQIASIPPNFSFVLVAFYYLIVATYIFVNYITWYFNVSLITNVRVIDIDFEDIIYKDVAETKLDLVQDVSYKQIGVIRTFYDYGDVLVQTAAAVDTFEMTAVPRPQRVVEVVENLIGKEHALHA